MRAEQIAAADKAAAEDARRTADTMTAHINELTAERNELRRKAAYADKLAEDLATANVHIKELTAAAEIAAARAETDKAQAISTVKDELRGDLDKLRDKLDTVKDELTAAKNELYRVTAERDEICLTFLSLYAILSLKQAIVSDPENWTWVSVYIRVAF